MKVETLSVPEALAQRGALPWAWVRSFSAVSLGITPDELDVNELLEARFFSENREIRLFRRDGELSAVCLEREDADHLMEQTYNIQNPRFGGALTVCHMLEADEDGQTFIAATRLTGWKEAQSHG